MIDRSIAERKVPREALLLQAEQVAREEGAWSGSDYIASPDCLELESKIQSNANSHVLRVILEAMAVPSMMRAALALMTGKLASAELLRDTWTLEGFAAQFGEQRWLENIASVNSYEVLREQFPIGGRFVWIFSHAAWGQYAAGLDASWRESAALLKVMRLRGEGRFLEGLEFEHMPWALTEFLSVSAPTAKSLSALGHAAPFAGIEGAWSDDEKFSEFVSGLADWHLQRTYRASRYDSGNSLLPTWIFALDHARKLATGKSCLPDHPLLAYGKRVFAADFSGPAHPVVATVEAEYERRYGEAPTDFERIWVKFLARKDMAPKS